MKIYRKLATWKIEVAGYTAAERIGCKSPKILDKGIINENIGWIIMPYIQGETLNKRNRKIDDEIYRQIGEEHYKIHSYPLEKLSDIININSIKSEYV